MCPQIVQAAGESASSGEYPSQTGGGNAGNNQNTYNPTETLDDDWLLPDEANRREDSGLLDLTPESAFNKMVSDPMFRAMLEQFLRNRATWPDPDVMSDKSIWDSCMQLYWRVKFHQTLSAAEKARFESSLNGATEDKRTPLCDHWVFWFAPESVRLFVLAPEAAAEIAQQRSARAALVGKLASADSKAHYRALMDMYRSGKYTNEMLNSTAGVYGEHFLAVLGVPLKGTQLAKEAVENVGGLASGVNKVDNVPRGARGPATAWDGFYEALAGGPVRDLTTGRVKIQGNGIDVVERHLARFGPDKANSVMVQRLRDIADGKITATAQDLNFYTHELREFVRYRRLGWRNGVPGNADAATDLWRQTHSATLDDYGFPLQADDLLYHPDALKFLWE